MENSVKLGFIWHDIDSSNLGVAALAISNIKIFLDVINRCDIEKCDIHLISDKNFNQGQFGSLFRDYKKTRFHFTRFSMKELAFNPVKLGKFIWLISTFDLIIDNSAGDSFSDIYGIFRFIKQACIKMLAIVFKIKLILSPQTIGPYNMKISKLIADYIMERAETVFARDKYSFNLIPEKAKKKLSTDVAFALNYDEKRSYDEFDKEKINFGINVSGLLWNGGYNRNNQFRLGHSYQEYLVSLIELILSENKNIKLHLIPHVIVDQVGNKSECDFLASIHLLKRISCNVCVPKFCNPMDAKTYISNLDFFVGARMHSTIASISSGVPTVAYSYSQKFEGLFASIEYKYLIPATHLSLDEALMMTINMYNDRLNIEQNLVSTKKIIEMYKAQYIIHIGEIVKRIACES